MPPTSRRTPGSHRLTEVMRFGCGPCLPPWADVTRRLARVSAMRNTELGPESIDRVTGPVLPAPAGMIPLSIRRLPTGLCAPCECRDDRGMRKTTGRRVSPGGIRRRSPYRTPITGWTNLARRERCALRWSETRSPRRAEPRLGDRPQRVRLTSVRTITQGRPDRLPRLAETALAGLRRRDRACADRRDADVAYGLIDGFLPSQVRADDPI